MKKLINSQGQVLLPRLRVAESIIERTQGLIGTKKLSLEEGVWFPRCNSIHTYFMSMPIDCIFLDKELRVKKIITNLKPWRLVWPVWGASSVIEISAGTSAKWNLKSGEVLHVST